MKKFNIPTLVKAINLMGKRKYLFLGAVLFFCVMEVFGSVLGTTGLKGAINAVGSKDVRLFWRSISFIILNVSLWGIYAPICFYISDKVSIATIRDVKTNLCEHIIKLPMEYHDGKKKGELLSVLSSDCSCLQEIYIWNLREVLQYALDGIGGLVIMAVIDWRFAIIVFSFGTLSVWVTSLFSEKLEKEGKEQQESISKTNTDAYELIKGAKTIRLFQLQQKKQYEFIDSTQVETDIKMKIGRISAKMNCATIGINMAVYIAILFVGALFVHYQLSDWGTVIALMSLKSIADMLFVHCVRLMAEMQKNIAGVKRLFTIWEVPAETLSHRFLIQKQEAAVSLRKVAFAYNDKTTVLEDLSMEVFDRQMTALIGQSGSGKSTVLKILLALYHPDQGQVVFNGSDSLTIETLRGMTAYVPQESMLYGGSIWDNITGENEAVQEEDVVEAAKLAGADEFIKIMPDGYHSVLLDDGKSLSGGQKQRIAIARALVKDAPILLLDEITSALDPETEQEILKTIQKISKYKAVLWITHNQEIAASADKIYQMS